MPTGWKRHVVGASLLSISLATSIAGAAPAATTQSSTAPSTQPESELPAWPLTGDWFGTRQNLADRGVRFHITLTVDGTKNLLGGLTTAGSVWRMLFDAAMTIDTKPLFGLDGGTIYADFQVAQGPNASEELIGDIQGIDNIDGVPGTQFQDRTQLAQLWYQQAAFDGVLRIKVGKVDANTEFDRSAFAQEFLNQSAGASATLFTLPTYPDPAFGMNIFLKPDKEWQIGFGIYNGSLANGVATGATGPGNFFSSHDLFLIGEIDKSWTLGADQLAGRAAIGGWYSTNNFQELNGGTVSGTGGPYALLDQTLWRANPRDDNDARGIGMFVMAGWADPSILQFNYNIGGGVTWTGPLDARPSDILGVGAQAVHFGQDFNPKNNFEVSYELFYRLQLTPWFAIKPDLQYVQNPGGQGTPNALAFTLRFQINF